MNPESFGFKVFFLRNYFPWGVTSPKIFITLKHFDKKEVRRWKCRTYKWKLRSNCQKVFLGKGVLKIYRYTEGQFTEEHPSRSVISIKSLCNFIEITLGHGCSPVKLLYIFRTSFSQNTSEGLLLRAFCSRKIFWNILWPISYQCHFNLFHNYL